MGHRALVAYERPDGLFNAHYSWWGASDLHLKTAITPETPLGGDPAEPGYVSAFTSMLSDAADAADLKLDGEATSAQDAHDVKPDPFMAGLDMPTVLTDGWAEAAFEALYVVSYDPDELIDDVHAFHPFSVIGDATGGDDGTTDDATAAADSTSTELFFDARWVDGEPVSDSHDRGWLRGRRETYRECIDKGLLTATEGRERLLTAICERFKQRLSQKLLAVSPAIEPAHLKAHPGAFLHLSGRSRVLGEMYPTDITDPEPWELPASFPAVKTATGDRVQLPTAEHPGDVHS